MHIQSESRSYIFKLHDQQKTKNAQYYKFYSINMPYLISFFKWYLT